MKKMVINRISDPKNRTKILTISQKMRDKEAVTHVQKQFVYMAFHAEEVNPKPEPPHIYIKKQFDTKKKTERCLFQIKGSFYITHKRLLFRVRFQHTLNISIAWKTKDFSPKKSEVLTK